MAERGWPKGIFDRVSRHAYHAVRRARGYDSMTPTARAEWAWAMDVMARRAGTLRVRVLIPTRRQVDKARRSARGAHLTVYSTPVPREWRGTAAAAIEISGPQEAVLLWLRSARYDWEEV